MYQVLKLHPNHLLKELKKKVQRQPSYIHHQIQVGFLDENLSHGVRIKNSSLQNCWPHVTRHLVTSKIWCTAFSWKNESSVTISPKWGSDMAGSLTTMEPTSLSILTQGISSRTGTCWTTTASWNTRAASPPPKPGREASTPVIASWTTSSRTRWRSFVVLHGDAHFVPNNFTKAGQLRISETRGKVV